MVWTNIVLCALLLLLTTTSIYAEYKKDWAQDAPDDVIYFETGDARRDVLVNDFLRRHFFAYHGPGAYNGDQQTLWREWNALCTLPVDTKRVTTPFQGREVDMNADLREVLLTTGLDDEGYVYTYPPKSHYPNKIGWPFPDYTHSAGGTTGWTWLASTKARGTDGWDLSDCHGWRYEGNKITFDFAPGGYLETTGLQIDHYQSPYIIIQMIHTQGGKARLYWQTKTDSAWDEKKSCDFIVDANADKNYYVPVYRNPDWSDEITGLRIVPLIDSEDDYTVSIRRVHCAYDTRHPVNNTSFILASDRYYNWTGDDDFLKKNISRLRAAARFLRHYMQADKYGFPVIDFWGHDGTSGIGRPGYGIGSDYYDLLPMGYKSCYLAGYYSAAMRAMSSLEKSAKKTGITGCKYYDAKSYEDAAKRADTTGSEFFWDDEKGRFIGCEDVDGVRHDYGFVIHNLEATWYGMATGDQMKKIYEWVDGKRIIEGDTSTGKDIYHFTMSPRATTKRNTDWYVWLWSGAASIPFGDQIQDGGTVLYLSFYDVLHRMDVYGPQNAFKRFNDVLKWYEMVQDAGGYREYYKPENGRGTLQGGGTAGGIGIDAEFVETTLVPLVLLYGFMGVDATGSSLVVSPRLPEDMPKLTVRNLHFRGCMFDVAATNDSVTFKCTSNPQEACFTVDGQTVSGTFEAATDAPARLECN